MIHPQRYPSGIDLVHETKTNLKERHQSRKDLEQRTVKNRSTHPQGNLSMKDLAKTGRKNPKEKHLSRTDSAIDPSHLDRTSVPQLVHA